jgi:hypothetical protein
MEALGNLAPRRHGSPRSSGGALAQGLLVACVASRTVGLPVLHPAPEAVDPVGVITKGVEVVAVVLSLHLFVENASGSHRCQGKRRTRWITISPSRAGL